MRCIEFTLNGVRRAIAGGEHVHSIDSRLYFFPPTGKGSFTVAGYVTSAASLRDRIYWTDGDLKVGDELHVRVIDSDAADPAASSPEFGESLTPRGSQQICLFCGKSNNEPIFFMTAKNGAAICGGCIAQAGETMKTLDGLPNDHRPL